jgi:triosephosphate isomerase
VTRPLTFAANWKMHHGPAATAAFMDRFLELMPHAPGGTELWFFPSACSLVTVAAFLRGCEDTHAGAQNIYWEAKGAFTGELSAEMAREAGASGALVGHSERRHVFGETDQEAGRKVQAAFRAGLVPMLCVGETLAEREAGETEAVCLRQLRAGLAGVTPEQVGQVIVAYEPVWAIGTGRNATPAHAAEVHRVIRAEVRRLALAPAGVTASAARVLYGGSVNAGNVAALLAEPELDGVLVGGASLDPEGWAALIRAGSGG